MTQLEKKKSKVDPEFVKRIERGTNRKITNNITIQSFHFFNEVFNNLFEDVSGNVIKEFIDLYQKNIQFLSLNTTENNVNF